MHPVANIRGAASSLLAGRRIVMGVSGSIAAVKCVELARELVRHGAEVHAVMSQAATGIIHPDALHFGTGNPVVTRLSGAVEHVALLGDVPERADLLLLAPATANTISKVALGIDDGPVTTCATVAVGTRTPIVVAPAMHDAMLDHPIVARHARTLIEELGATWVEPRHEERKAKLADIDAIVDAVIRRLATGPLVGRRVLVVGGGTAEPVDPTRVLGNRSSGRSATLLAHELHRLGAHVTFWYGQGTAPVPASLEDSTVRFERHEHLMGLADAAEGFDDVWMPAAISDYAPEAARAKIASGKDSLQIPLRPLPKVIERLRKQLPEAQLIAFKAESDASQLLARAAARLERYGAQWIVANTDAAFGADDTDVWLLGADGSQRRFTGPKEEVMRQLIASVAGAVQVAAS